MSGNPLVDAAALREEVKKKYRDVAIKPPPAIGFEFVMPTSLWAGPHG